MTEDELMAAIVAELSRQGKKDGAGPYLYNQCGDEIGVDGVVNLRELAKAVRDVAKQPIR